jgi:phenylalanyl-tRNA synthetase beta chain
VAVPEEVASATSSRRPARAAGPELREIRVFDVYRGDQLGEGRKSVASRSRTSRRTGRSPTRTPRSARRDRRRARERFGAELSLNRLLLGRQ